MFERKNKFLENLEYQISLKENTYKNIKKLPIFTEQVERFDKAMINLQEKFDRIHIRDKYQIIISELEELIHEAKK
ncbi:MAG: hypothetical protein ACFFEN_12815 [Candidatus Thorarchaeota archaeon]